MLAEKFFLTLETIISHTADLEPARHPDGAPQVVCGQHVPIKLPEIKPSDQAQSQTVE
jgi:hypothetical protein